MPFRKSNQGSFRRSGARRLTEWSICSAPTGFSVVAAGVKILLVLVPEVTLSAIAPGTVVRVRGAFSILPTNPSVNTAMNGAFGMGFVNGVAGGLGITAVPGPATDCDWGGWFVHQFFNHKWDVTTDIDRHLISTEYMIDSKAMRKFEAGMALAWVVENFGVSSFDAAISARMLVKAG